MLFSVHLKFLLNFVIIFHLKSVYGDYINDTEYYSIPQISKIEYFDECRWKGNDYKYCLFEMKIFPIENTSSRTWEIIQILNEDKLNLRHDLIERGHCLKINPSLTKDDEIAQYTKKYNQEFYNHSLQVKIWKVSCNYFHDELDKYDIIMIVILVAIVMIGLVCTTIDVLYFRQKTNSLISTKLIQSFSINKNWIKLLTIKNSDQSMKFVQGIRFLTMVFIMFGHAVVTQFNSPVFNSGFYEKFFKIPSSAIIMNGPVLMSKRKFHVQYILWAFFERFVRLTPVFLLLTLFSATLFYHMGNGAYWERNIGYERENCRKNWWANILYISNELKSTEICLLTGWFLSADMQLFIFALILFTILWFKKKWILHILIGLLVISLIIPGVITYVYRLDPQLMTYPETLRRIFRNYKTYHLTYLKAYTNASAYILGIIIGYTIHTGSIKKVPTNPLWFNILSVLGQVLGVLCSVGLLLVGYIFYTKYYSYNIIFASIFASLYKLVFTMLTVLLVWGSVIRVGTFYLKILEWTPFVILGRLSFTMYLVHWPLLRFLSSRHSIEYYHDFYSLLVIRYFSTLVMTIMLAGIVSLLIEFPTASLIKILKDTFEKSNRSDTNDPKPNSNGQIVQSVMMPPSYDVSNGKPSQIFNIEKFNYNRERIE